MKKNPTTEQIQLFRNCYNTSSEGHTSKAMLLVSSSRFFWQRLRITLHCKIRGLIQGALYLK